MDPVSLVSPQHPRKDPPIPEISGFLHRWLRYLFPWIGKGKHQVHTSRLWKGDEASKQHYESLARGAVTAIEQERHEKNSIEEEIARKKNLWTRKNLDLFVDTFGMTDNEQALFKLRVEPFLIRKKGDKYFLISKRDKGELLERELMVTTNGKIRIKGTDREYEYGEFMRTQLALAFEDQQKKWEYLLTKGRGIRADYTIYIKQHRDTPGLKKVHFKITDDGKIQRLGRLGVASGKIYNTVGELVGKLQRDENSVRKEIESCEAYRKANENVPLLHKNFLMVGKEGEYFIHKLDDTRGIYRVVYCTKHHQENVEDFRINEEGEILWEKEVYDDLAEFVESLSKKKKISLHAWKRPTHS